MEPRDPEAPEEEREKMRALGGEDMRDSDSDPSTKENLEFVPPTTSGKSLVAALSSLSALSVSRSVFSVSRSVLGCLPPVVFGGLKAAVAIIFMFPPADRTRMNRGPSKNTTIRVTPKELCEFASSSPINPARTIRAARKKTLTAFESMMPRVESSEFWNGRKAVKRKVKPSDTRRPKTGATTSSLEMMPTTDARRSRRMHSIASQK
mmetsp:Transcript_8945/g.16363  ORF Transcript_8945/g.16363 Transcript_8945/m.16363 type:complete len:207 (+) Transcript_8945:615-1235(+)